MTGSLKLSIPTVILLFILRISPDYSNQQARTFHYHEMLIYTLPYQNFMYFLVSLLLLVSTEISSFSVHQICPSKQKTATTTNYKFVFSQSIVINSEHLSLST
jgi:hypothetical protein